MFIWEEIARDSSIYLIFIQSIYYFSILFDCFRLFFPGLLNIDQFFLNDCCCWLWILKHSCNQKFSEIQLMIYSYGALEILVISYRTLNHGLGLTRIMRNFVRIATILEDSLFHTKKKVQHNIMKKKVWFHFNSLDRWGKSIWFY